jgi:hypothetical protein
MATEPDKSGPFRSLEETLRSHGPSATLECLIEHLDEQGEYRALLDALLLRARHDLGLPRLTFGSLANLPEPARSRYEEKYVEALRLVGSRHLASGDIPTAWAYYRAIGEPEPVAQAIGDYRPAENDERLGAVIEIAFNHGVCPERGFTLILDNYGTCPAITAFEQLPAHEETTRTACAVRLIRHLHGELAANLRAEIVSRGHEGPAEGSGIAAMVHAHPWIFADEGYHIDVSHLASVVRMSLLVADPEVWALAVDLTEYGRKLSPRLLFDGPPPFEKIFDDHGIYLKALLGEDVDRAIAHFRGKLPVDQDGETDAVLPAQTLVNLLVKLGRVAEAIDVASEYLGGFPESALACPGVAQLCLSAGQPDRLAAIARERGDLVTYTAALLEIRAVSETPSSTWDVRAMATPSGGDRHN